MKLCLIRISINCGLNGIFSKMNKYNKYYKLKLINILLIFSILPINSYAEKDKLSACYYFLQGGTYNYMLEQGCGFNGNVARMSFDLYNKANCDSIVSQKAYNKLVKEVLDDTKRRFKKLGKNEFCEGNKSAYDELVPSLSLKDNSENSVRAKENALNEDNQDVLPTCYQQFESLSMYKHYSAECQLTETRSKFLKHYANNYKNQCTASPSSEVKKKIVNRLQVNKKRQYLEISEGLSKEESNELWCKAINSIIDKSISEN